MYVGFLSEPLENDRGVLSSQRALGVSGTRALTQGPRTLSVVPVASLSAVAPSGGSSPAPLTGGSRQPSSWCPVVGSWFPVFLAFFGLDLSKSTAGPLVCGMSLVWICPFYPPNEVQGIRF